MSNQEINCLRCRSCQLLPSTDFNRAATVIHCGKLGYNQTLNLSGCGLAVPVTRYQGNNKAGQRASKPNGDKTRNASPVEIAYLRAHLHHADWETLARHTGRTRGTLLVMSRTHSIGEPGQRRAPITPQTRQRISHAAQLKRQSKKQIINAAQSEYIMRRYESGDWPARGGWNHPKALERRYVLQAEIVEAVAQLGPRWSWYSIVKHPRWKSPGYLRYSAQKRAQRAATARNESKHVREGKKPLYTA